MGLPIAAGAMPWNARGDVSLRKIVETRAVDDSVVLRDSLRRDVGAHPADFIVFETEAGAKRFEAEHWMSLRPEANERLVSLGVVGYWEGKTLVVLPLEPGKNF
jgi:hypothetical protein